MASFLQYKTNGIQWAVWKMEESLDALLLLLPGARRAFCEQELNRFVSERRKMEWLSVRVLLYSMLQEDKEIGYSPEGKPYLTDHSFFISISHTKGYVAVMLASSVPVGIDIEQYAQRVHKVCDRYVRPDEQVESYQGDITWGLLLHWSAKEAVFKRMENADADAFYSSRGGDVSGSGVSYGAARTLFCRLSYLSGLCIDVDIELNGRGNV